MQQWKSYRREGKLRECGPANPEECDMVWLITERESYVGGTGKSMKAEELAIPQGGSWRKIPISLKMPVGRGFEFP